MSTAKGTGSFSFFQNSGCEYFPCHKTPDPENFNCLFCFCPLYSLGEDCGGNFTVTSSGVKDCSGCAIPHEPGGYDYVMKRIDAVIKAVGMDKKSPEEK